MALSIGGGITFGGGITIATPPPDLYTPLAGSLQFNGTDQYLGLSPGVTIGAGAFTLEGWFFNTGTWATPAPLLGTDQTGGLSLFNNDEQSFTLDKYGGGGTTAHTFPPNTLQTGKWQYIILSRNSSQDEAMWVGTFVDNANLVTCDRSNSGVVNDGLDFSGVSNQIGHYYGGFFAGNITNFRATIGTAVYDPNSTTVTAPTAPLTVLGDTQYLMLGADVTTDTSGTQTVTNSFGVTQSGTKPF